MGFVVEVVSPRSILHFTNRLRTFRELSILWAMVSFVHGVVNLTHMELLPLYTWSCYPYTHGVVTLIHTYKDAPLVGKGCAVIGKASVQSGPLQTGEVGSK